MQSSADCSSRLQSFLINGNAYFGDCTLLPGQGDGKAETTCNVTSYLVPGGESYRALVSVTARHFTCAFKLCRVRLLAGQAKLAALQCSLQTGTLQQLGVSHTSCSLCLRIASCCPCLHIASC